jgi:hypothetical protein
MTFDGRPPRDIAPARITIGTLLLSFLPGHPALADPAAPPGVAATDPSRAPASRAVALKLSRQLSRRNPRESIAETPKGSRAPPAIPPLSCPP